MGEDKPLVEKYGFREEIAEEFNVEQFGGYVRTGYPSPFKRFKLVYESERASIEDTYFWIHTNIREDQGFGNITKTIDTLAAAEHSSFWGMIQQRKGLQQDRASQYLQTIGKMIQDLFKLVREIRILKERLSLYEGAKSGKQADDIALKGYWVDMVEGGTKGQSNIYTMAQQLGFGTLPDLFFGIYVQKKEDIDKVVQLKAGEFNEKVREVLRRKLANYMAWRLHTEEELRHRERFTLRYLRQHWAVIRMYISWVKPYLRNVSKLEAPDKYERDAQLISSFEGALIEIEFIAQRAPQKNGIRPTMLASFEYRVKPKMEFHADSYQHKGPAHVGRVEVSLRCYGWSEEDTKEYIRYRDEETLELIGMVDESVRDALDALGEELMQYLKEAGEDVDFGKKKAPSDREKKKRMNLFEPFTALFGGFKDIFGFGVESAKGAVPKKDAGYRGESEEAINAAKHAHKPMYLTYKYYKKMHQMPNLG